MTDSLGLRYTPALSGAGLLGLVTTGMYDAPLSIYREYIQNTADAVARSGSSKRARVTIETDASERRIKIRDDGPGLSRTEAHKRLLPIGRSDKTVGIDRGFRGVGRLAGLAFAKTVCFTTRSRENREVTQITWHSDRLPELTSTESELEEAIRDCVEEKILTGSDYPEHFFQVEVRGVARHSAGLLLNRDAVRDYVGEVCPVSMSAEFPFAGQVERLFHDAGAPLTLEVMLDGDPHPIERPYGKSVPLSTTKDAEFTGFQRIYIPSIDGKAEAALGWIAHWSYLGAIPKQRQVRGIRARVGNIQIGGEAVFDHLFAEERFNRWCVGELHILDPRIIPNGRRDYFEPGPHLRNLENQLTPVLRGISTRCRRESTARNRARKTLSALGNIEDLCALANSGCLSPDDSASLTRKALREVEKLRELIYKADLDTDTLKRLDNAEERLGTSSVERSPQQFGNMPPSEIEVYQRVFGALVKFAPSPASARELIESVIAEASQARQNGSRPDLDQRTENHPLPLIGLNDAGSLTPRQ